MTTCRAARRLIEETATEEDVERALGRIAATPRMPESEARTPTIGSVQAVESADDNSDDGIDWPFWERIYGPSARQMPEMCNDVAFNRMQRRASELNVYMADKIQQQVGA